MRRDKSFAGDAAYGALFLITVLSVWLFCLRHGLFGAKVDWISQHSVLPDYFRRQFYETFHLFPEFAANIGGGQNIYNFSYYGLLSPVILPAYLLPFVEMGDYMMAAQFVCLTVSVMLLYRWLLGRGFEKKICFCESLMFLLSGPMIYHSYNQIMFVNYMPFLCMGFIGVDKYFEEKKRRHGGLLTVSIFLMIMTSFYFSIGGMLSLSLYGLHHYVREREEVHGVLDAGKHPGIWKAEARMFLKEGFYFLRSFLTAVLMSGVLLLPTAMAMAGRNGGGVEITLSELFWPKVCLGRFFYTPYGMGLTTLVFTALAAMAFFRRWSERALAWGCIGILFLPVFAWLLNGGLYVRDKVMIPFLPLMCYMTAYYLDRMRVGRLRDAAAGAGEIKRLRAGAFRGAIPYVAVFCILWLHFARYGTGKCGRFVLGDSLLMLVCYGIYCVRKNNYIMLLPPILLLGVFGNGYHEAAAKYLDREFYEKVTDQAVERLAERAAAREKGFYRTAQFGTEDENAANLNRIWDMRQYVPSIYSSLYNDEYQRFRRAFKVQEPYRNFLMQSGSENPIYRRFMGVKYLIANRSSKKEMSQEYVLKDTEKDWGLYKNSLASPAAYATDKLMSKEEYEVLGFPENQLSLLEAAVVEEGGGYAQKNSGSRELIPVQISLPKEIDSQKTETIRADIPQTEKQPGFLFLRFEVENLKPSKDVAVWVEGQRNKLTSRKHFYYNGNRDFTYVVPLQKDQSSLKMVFGEGHYRIFDMQCFLGELPTRREAETLYQSELLIDKGKTKGNVIAGDIDVKNNGYFITIIPYDENFEISVDGKSVKVQKVNTAFLGCKIEKGKHEVEIVFHAPGMAAGKIMSILGILMFVCVSFGAEVLLYWRNITCKT